MIVKSQKRIEFINDCNCIVDYNELEKAIIWYQQKPTSRLRHIYLHGNYPAISINTEKIHVHRLLMEYWLKTNIPRNYYVHHINENKLDARKENLALIFITTHQSKHNKGKIISQKQRNVTIESNHRRKGIKRGIIKKDITYKKIWELHKKGFSINKISKELNYDWSQVKTRIDEIYDNPELLRGE